MDCRERVKRAIKFDSPDRVPLFLYNKDQQDSDMVVIEVVDQFAGECGKNSEWGFRWKKLDNTMGHPEEPVIKTWNDLDGFIVPNAFRKSRFRKVQDIMRQYGNKYYLASLALTGFTVMSCLRGFENFLVDLYTEKGKVDLLAEIVFGFENDIIAQLKDYGFDGVAFFDDWGTQKGLLISPKLWREYFKPKYKKQFELAHAHNLDVYFHSCGFIQEIIPDFIEIGVDMLNLSQPNIFDIADIGKRYGGKVCFVCPISYQTTSITGTKEEIYREAKKLIQHLGRANGGFIGYVEEYSSIGMTDENYCHCINAFIKYGKYGVNSETSFQRLE